MPMQYCSFIRELHSIFANIKKLVSVKSNYLEESPNEIHGFEFFAFYLITSSHKKKPKYLLTKMIKHLILQTFEINKIQELKSIKIHLIYFL